MQKATQNSGGVEWDLILSHWDLFTIKQPLSFDSIKYGEVQRPDVLSYRIYGSSEYWWILCKFNQIDDMWNDMYVGMDIVIPNMLDINEFYSNMRRRVRTQNV